MVGKLEEGTGLKGRKPHHGPMQRAHLLYSEPKFQLKAVLQKVRKRLATDPCRREAIEAYPGMDNSWDGRCPALIRATVPAENEEALVNPCFADWRGHQRRPSFIADRGQQGASAMSIGVGGRRQC